MIQKWKQKKNFTTIQDVVEHNVGIPIRKFLHPNKNPNLKGLDEAADFIRQADRLVVIADYDADGVSSALIFSLLLKELGKEFEVYIPRRFSDGYGISEKILEKIGPGDIITVDNGIAAAEVIETAKKAGRRVFVVDHHLKRDDGRLPDCGILDPHIEEESDFKDYCGAGLAYRIADLMLDDENVKDKALVFAAIATVADVVPLRGDNRNIVREGLEKMNAGFGTTGIQTLIKRLSLEDISAKDLGFRIGPIINASGRLYDKGPMGVYMVLSTDLDFFEDAYEEKLKALEKNIDLLIAINKKRQNLVKDQYEKCQNLLDEGQKFKVVYDPEFHEGIIGILAGNISEDTRRPALVFTDAGTDGYLKGSGRSNTVHLKNELDKVSYLIEKYGGHAGAAGLTIRKDMLQELTKELNANMKDVELPENEITYDLEISPEEIESTVETLRKFAPFGEGNPEPSFLICGVKAEPISGKLFKPMGTTKEHIKVQSKDAEFLLFGMANRFEEDDFPPSFDCIGFLSNHRFHGKDTAQVEVLDYSKTEKETTELFDDLASLLVFE